MANEIHPHSCECLTCDLGNLVLVQMRRIRQQQKEIERLEAALSEARLREVLK